MSRTRMFLLASVLPVVLARAAYGATIFTPPVIPTMTAISSVW